MRWLLLFCLIVGLSAGDADQPPVAVASLSSLLDQDEDDARKALAERGPAAIDGLIALLDSAEENRLANLLGGLGAIAKAHPETLPRVLSILRAACQRKGYWFMAGVSDATEELEERAAPLVPDLIRQLERQDDDGLNPVFWSLYRIGEPALPAAERVARFLGGAQEEMALNVLPKLGNGIAPIIRRLVDERPLTTLQIVDELPAPTPEILALIRPLLAHGQVDVRALAVAVWCKQAPEDLPAVVKAAATDSADPVRLAATKYLSHLPDQDAGPIALALLAVDDPEVVANALWRVGSVGLPRGSTCAQVLPFLHSKDAKVRRCAVRALGQLGSGLHGGRGFTDRIDDPADTNLRTQVIAALRPLLSDPETDVVTETTTTLGALGLADQDFRHWLLNHLADVRSGWTCAGVLKELGLGMDDIPILLALLRDPDAQRRRMVMHIAPVLQPRDMRVTEAVIAGLTDPDARVRSYAAVALGEMGAEAAQAYDALVKCLDDSDDNTAGPAARALGSLGDGVIEQLRRDLRSGRHPVTFARALGVHDTAAAAAIPDVIASLKMDPGNRGPYLMVLGSIGKGDATARATVLAHVRDADEVVASDAMMAITEIGLDESSARIVATLTVDGSDFHASMIFDALLPWPDLAEAFIRLNPVTIRGHTVSDVVAGWKPAEPAIRTMILRQPDLPMTVLALSGDVGHLPTLRAAKDAARGYGASHLAAYARMLGDPADVVVKISTMDPGRFRPSSAWPRVDRRRMKPKADGHGDGFTEIVVTGVVRLADGSHPKVIRFVGLNDRMLLGKREEHEEKRVLYNAMTGRFALFSTVFAAYSSGEGKAEEEGPYQTGSLTTRLVADGAKPLRVVFYDEMPDVEITVDPAK